MKTLATTAFLVVFAFSSAHAKQIPVGKCGPRAGLVKILEKNHREEQLSIGLDKRGGLFELWGNRKTSSFTMFVTSPTMISCIVGTGKALEIVQPKPVHH